MFSLSLIGSLVCVGSQVDWGLLCVEFDWEDGYG